MKFSTLSTDLYRALDTVSGALASKADKEILNCILMEKKGNLLELRATDLEVAIQHRVPVTFSDRENLTHEVVAVPAKQFLETCRALPDVPITLEVESNYNIILSHDDGSYNWRGFSGEEFPPLPVIENAQSVKFNRGRLRSGFNLVEFTVAKDISRPGMMGVLFEIAGGSARVVATDGHRLARCIFKNYEGKLDLRALVPLKAFQQATRIEGTDECTVHVTENHIAYDFGATLVIGTLINTSFPNYERAIPDENDKILHVNREEISNSVRRVNFFASQSSNHIVLDCMEDQIRINARDLERSSKGEETVLCEYRGEPTQIGFNAQYLQELLRHLPAEEISMSMGISSRAALLRPVPQGELEDVTYLIMPIMLNKIEK